MPETDKTPEQAALIHKAWRKWVALVLPLAALSATGLSLFGPKVVIPVLFGGLLVTFAYQRIVNKRSWHSIIRGVSGVKE